MQVVRLLRVVLSMSRLQRSRDRYRRLKMVGLGAPVEKVFEIIAELRVKMAQPEDLKALAWTMDLIAKEELYQVDFDSRSSHMGIGHLTAEMTDWLRANLQVGTAAMPYVHAFVFRSSSGMLTSDDESSFEPHQQSHSPWRCRLMRSATNVRTRQKCHQQRERGRRC